MLHLDAVDAGYGSSQVLFGLGLEAGARQVTSLVGRNGMGKSTTVRTVLGLVPLRGGRIVFDGHDLGGLAPNRIARLGIGLVPEGRRVFGSLSVEENLIATARAAPTAGGGWTLARVVALFPRLGERRTQSARTLSGGEQQMLAIGRALMTNPRLLILDEATEGLAPMVREEIWTCLTRLRAGGQSILVVDKYVEKLIALADRHSIIQRGQVVWQGSSAALDADHGVWHRYLGIG